MRRFSNVCAALTFSASCLITFTTAQAAISVMGWDLHVQVASAPVGGPFEHTIASGPMSLPFAFAMPDNVGNGVATSGAQYFFNGAADQSSANFDIQFTHVVNQFGGNFARTDDQTGAPSRQVHLHFGLPVHYEVHGHYDRNGQGDFLFNASLVPDVGAAIFNDMQSVTGGGPPLVVNRSGNIPAGDYFAGYDMKLSNVPSNSAGQGQLTFFFTEQVPEPAMRGVIVFGIAVLATGRSRVVR